MLHEKNKDSDLDSIESHAGLGSGTDSPDIYP
jgi:hypothetical protein